MKKNDTYYPMQKERQVQILYFNNDCREFRFQSEDLPSQEQVDKLWKKLPDWVWKKMDDDPSIYFMHNDEQLCDGIFYRLNHYDLNPLSPDFYEDGNMIGQNWMKENNVGHTSMSVGDIVVIDGTHYYCASFGWKKLFQDEEE